MKNKIKKIKIIKIVLIVVIAVLSITLFSCNLRIGNHENKNSYEQYTRKVIDIFNENYLYSKNLEKDKITISLINGILSQDKYGRLELSNELIEINENKDQKLIGIQIKTTKHSKYFIKAFLNNNLKPKVKLLEENFQKVEKTDELKIGDELLYFEFDNTKKYIEGLSNQDYLNIAKSIPDKFKLAVKRLKGEYKGEYDKDSFDILLFEVEKQIINSEKVEESFSLSDDTYVLTLDSFSSLNSNVEEFIKKAYYIADSKNIEGKDYSKIKNVAIDLRDNGGGDLDILGLIIKVLYGTYDSKNIIQLQSKTQTQSYSVTNLVSKLRSRDQFSKSKLKDFPNIYEAVVSKTSSDALVQKRKDISIYLLSNDKTASASEAFIGISKNKNINPNFKKQIGQTTFGKGVAQSVIPFSDFYYNNKLSYLVITTSKYNILNSEMKFENIDKVGYKPEIDLELNPETERIFQDVKNNAVYKKLLEAIKNSNE